MAVQAVLYIPFYKFGLTYCCRWTLNNDVIDYVLELPICHLMIYYQLAILHFGYRLRVSYFLTLFGNADNRQLLLNNSKKLRRGRLQDKMNL